MGPEQQTLRIALLGTPEVAWAGQPWCIPRRQARALLFRLACDLRLHPRDYLAFLFWPDSPEVVARRSLTRLLTHLRRALPAGDLLMTGEYGVGLDPARVWSDVVEFTGLAAAGEWARAAALCRGPFLDGFSLSTSAEFEAWSLRERTSLEGRCLDCLETLIEVRTAQGAYGEAIAMAQRCLSMDELAEAVHRRLIELFAQAGDRAAALRQYERCVAVLERELGVDPSPETRAAYQSALHGHRPFEPAVAPDLPVPLPAFQAPLVGRDEALAQLMEAHHGAGAGRSAVVLILGEAGVGKSRLAQEFLLRAGDRGRHLTGGCHEAEQSLPYWPLIEALRPHAAAIAALMGDADAQHLAEAARLLPELAPAGHSLPTVLPSETGQEQGRLWAALALCVRRLAASRPPLVLCLDDLQWADEATLGWLGYLARHLQGVPVLILGACRIEERGRLALLHEEWSRAGILRDITLQNLEPDGVLHLVRHVAGQSAGMEELSQRLHLVSGGNPFYLLETLAALVEAGVLRQEEAGWSPGPDAAGAAYGDLPVPDSLVETIRVRLQRLSPQARQVLEAAAVIGRRFAFDAVQRTSGRRELEVVEALEELASRQVVRAENGGYGFRHDLIRAVVYGDLSYGRRRLLHRRAGEALARLRPDDVASLARHFEGAEEWRRAAGYALDASRAAKTLFAYSEARSGCDRALALLDRDAQGLAAGNEMAANQRLRIRVLDERGWVLRLLGEMDAYARDSAELARLAEMLGDAQMSAQAAWREAHAHRWFCRHRQAADAAEAGVRSARTAGDATLEAIWLRELGLAQRDLGQYGPARAALEQALALFTAAGETDYEVHTLGNLSTLLLMRGDAAGAMDLARQGMQRCEAAGLALARRLPLGDMGAAAIDVGLSGDARTWLEESLAISRQIADRTQEILCLGHLGWLDVTLGQQAAALEALEDALVLAERIDSRGEQSWLHAGLAEAHRLAGALPQARRHAQRALELARAHGRPHDERLARRLLGQLAGHR